MSKMLRWKCFWREPSTDISCINDRGLFHIWYCPSVNRSGQAIRGVGPSGAIPSHSTLHMTLNRARHVSRVVTNSTNINLDCCHWPRVAWRSSKPMNQDYCCCTRRIIPGQHLAWLSLCHGRRDIAMCQQNSVATNNRFEANRIIE